MKKVCLFLLVIGFIQDSLSQPNISSFSPRSGNVGSYVTIFGSNFSKISNNNVVYFGSVKAKISNATDTTITAIVPTGTSYMPISVTTNNLTCYSQSPFIVTFPNSPLFSDSSFNAKIDSITNVNYGITSIGDLDGDGKPDIIVAGVTNSFLVYRNTSGYQTLSFDNKKAFPFNYNAASKVSLSDIDGDGLLDVILLDQATNTVSILKNSSSIGNISFNSEIDYQTGNSPYDLAITDFDGDGKPDLAIVNISANTVSIYKNNSTGGVISFKPKKDITTGKGPLRISIGDLNGDKKPDFAVVNSNSNTFSAFINNTIGTDSISFASKLDFATGIFPNSIAIADLNDDAKLDVTVVNNGDSSISVFQNTTSGMNLSFAAKTNYQAGWSPIYISLADMDGDGFPDINLLNSYNNNFSIFKNNSSNSLISFLPKINYNVGNNSQVISIGDLDNDGKPDIVLASNTDNVISIIRNRINEPTITSFTPTAGGHGLVVKITGTRFLNVISVAFGDTPALSFTVDSPTQITAIVDVGSTGYVSVVTQTGTGRLRGFAYRPVINSFSPAQGQVGTTIVLKGSGFNNTLIKNIVYFGAIKSAPITVTDTTLTVKVPLGAIYLPISVTNTDNNLTGYSSQPFISTFSGGVIDTSSFTPKVNLGLTGVYPIMNVVGDLDGDGKSDVIVSNSASNTFTCFRNTSEKNQISFSSKLDFPLDSSLYTYGKSICIGDVDGDGKLDIIVSSENAAISPVSNILSIYRNISTKGNISFAPKKDIPLSSSSIRIQLADFNGDGRPDLALVNEAGGVTIFKNTCTVNSISFSQITDLLVGYSADISISDLDKDGKPDIAILNGTTSIFRNTSTNGDISFATKINVPTGFSPNSISIGDIDGDSLPDILFTNSGNNSFSVALNKSTVGNLSFQPKQDFQISNVPYNLTVGDIDGDGKLDVSIATRNNNTISVYKNLSNIGSISFASKVEFNTAYGYDNRYISIADVNQDGKPDIVVVNPGGSTNSWLSVLLNSINKSQSPTITSITPTIGINGTIVTITGSNFNGTTSVDFGGVSAQSFNVISNSQISAIIGLGLSGRVTVSSPIGIATFDSFVYVGTPIILANGTTTFCQGNKVKLISSSPTNQWYKNGILINGEVTDTLTVSSSGSYTATTSYNSIVSTASNLIVITVNSIPVKPLITKDISNNLVSSYTSGNQWYFDTTVVIPNATSQIYKPTISGLYAVNVIQNGCSSIFSDKYNYIVSAIMNVNNNNFIHITPNPASDVLLINFNLSNIYKLNIEVVDMNGKCLISKEGIISADKINIDKLGSGLYFIKLFNLKENFNFISKIIKL